MNLEDWKVSSGAIFSIFPMTCPVDERIESDVDEVFVPPDQLERVVTIRKSPAGFSSIEY
jgi:hypothetical protein